MEDIGGRVHGSPPWRSGLNPIEVKGWYSDGAIPVGTLFDLTVFGRLPTSDYKEFDASHAMRLKIVPYTPSSTCDDPIPPQVAGIGCEDLVYEAPESAQAGVFVHGSETTTLCAPGPASARPASRPSSSPRRRREKRRRRLTGAFVTVCRILEGSKGSDEMGGAEQELQP